MEAFVDELLLLADWLCLFLGEKVLGSLGLAVVDGGLDGLESLHVEKLFSSLFTAFEDVATLTNYHLNKSLY